MKIYYKLPLFLLLIIPSLLSGQKRWSLEECIRYAWENNLQIKQQELAVEQSENNLEQAKLNYVPTLNASISHSMNWGRSVNLQNLEIIQNKLTQSTSASARAAINVFEGFTKSNEVKSRSLQRDISVEEVDRIRNDISIEIARMYLQILLSKEMLKTVQNSIISVGDQVERTKKLVDAGSLPYSSLLEMQAQLAAEKVQVVNADNQLQNAVLALVQLLDLENDKDFDILDVDVDLMVKEFTGEKVNELYESSLELPQIRSARMKLTNADVQLAIAKGRVLPSVSFSAGYGTYYSDSREQAFFDQFNENRNP